MYQPQYLVLVFTTYSVVRMMGLPTMEPVDSPYSIWALNAPRFKTSGVYGFLWSFDCSSLQTYWTCRSENNTHRFHCGPWRSGVVVFLSQMIYIYIYMYAETIPVYSNTTNDKGQPLTDCGHKPVHPLVGMVVIESASTLRSMLWKLTPFQENRGVLLQIRRRGPRGLGLATKTSKNPKDMSPEFLETFQIYRLFQKISIDGWIYVICNKGISFCIKIYNFQMKLYINAWRQYTKMHQNIKFTIYMKDT